MSIATAGLLLAHLVAFAALLGGSLAQVRADPPEVNLAMLYGAWLSVITGLGLTALQLVGEGVDWAQTSVKLVLAAVLVLLVAKNRKFAEIPRGLLLLLAGLAFVEAAVAVLWT